MWYVACFVRGMSVDEALKQLPLVGRKGATIVRDTILEAQKLAVENHNVEFKTNLWIGKHIYFFLFNVMLNVLYTFFFIIIIFEFKARNAKLVFSK